MALILIYFSESGYTLSSLDLKNNSTIRYNSPLTIKEHGMANNMTLLDSVVSVKIFQKKRHVANNH